MLLEAGQRIKIALGKEGRVYRIGGDEFIGILEFDVSAENCMSAEQQIKKEQNHLLMVIMRLR